MIASRFADTDRKATEQAINPVAAVVSKAADVAGDFVELVELQTRLTKANSKQLVNQAIPAIFVVVIAAMLGVSAAGILLTAVAAALVELAGWSAWLSNLTVGLGGLCIALTAIVSGLAKLRASVKQMDASLNQLSQNFAWLKSIIRGE